MKKHAAIAFVFLALTAGAAAIEAERYAECRRVHPAWYCATER